MSTGDKASTVLMPGFWGYDADQPTAAEAERNQVMHGVGSADEALAEHPFGGVFLRPEVIADADQVDTLTGELHDAGDRPGGLPLLISIDQEGGVVQRLQVGVPVVPSAASIGQRGDPSYARQVARDNGRTLRRLGVTMVMAPVADVDPDGRSVMGLAHLLPRPRRRGPDGHRDGQGVPRGRRGPGGEALPRPGLGVRRQPPRAAGAGEVAGAAAPDRPGHLRGRGRRGGARRS